MLFVYSVFERSVIVEMDLIKLPIRIRQRKLNRAMSRCTSSAHFSHQILKSIGEVDLSTVLLSRNGVENWLTPDLNVIVDSNVAGAALDIDGEFYVEKGRVEDLLQCGGKDIPNGRSRIGFLSAHDSEQGLSLFVARVFTDDNKSTAATLMNSFRPLHRGDGFQTTEIHIAEMTAQNFHRVYGFAVTVCGQRIKLTGATVIAIAIGKGRGVDFPVNHRDSPRW